MFYASNALSALQKGQKRLSAEITPVPALRLAQLPDPRTLTLLPIMAFALGRVAPGSEGASAESSLSPGSADSAVSATLGERHSRTRRGSHHVLLPPRARAVPLKSIRKKKYARGAAPGAASLTRLTTFWRIPCAFQFPPSRSGADRHARVYPRVAAARVRRPRRRGLRRRRSWHRARSRAPARTDSGGGGVAASHHGASLGTASPSPTPAVARERSRALRDDLSAPYRYRVGAQRLTNPPAPVLCRVPQAMEAIATLAEANPSGFAGVASAALLAFVPMMPSLPGSAAAPHPTIAAAPPAARAAVARAFAAISEALAFAASNGSEEEAGQPLPADVSDTLAGAFDAYRTVGIADPDPAVRRASLQAVASMAQMVPRGVLAVALASLLPALSAAAKREPEESRGPAATAMARVLQAAAGNGILDTGAAAAAVTATLVLLGPPPDFAQGTSESSAGAMRAHAELLRAFETAARHVFGLPKPRLSCQVRLSLAAIRHASHGTALT